MVKFTIQQVRNIMNNQNNIRNMSVIAHVDHGKTTLVDSLIQLAGIIPEDKNQRYMQSHHLEQSKGITIKSNGISLYYQYEDKSLKSSQEYLVNLIDSPGHVDFSSEVTAALRVSDGALVVVDYVEGICVQTETVLRQALQELIKPVLFINKVDRAIFELHHDSETIYQNLQRIIESFNVIVATYQNESLMGDCTVNPLHGNVAFGSAYFGWGFTLNTFANIYSEKQKIDRKTILQKLWGDNYFDSHEKKWKTESVTSDERILPRAFCSLIMDPILKLTKTINEEDMDSLSGMLSKLDIKMTNEELNLRGKALFRKVFQNWINAANSLLEMITQHLPSPIVAQKYRTQILYEGDLDDECAHAMMTCDANGPLMMFVSKMVPAESGRFYAFGRVFSGTIGVSTKIRILGPHYKQGKSEDMFEKQVQRLVLLMGRKVEDIIDVPCGNLCAVVGIDNCLLKNGTITTHPHAGLIKSMKFSVSPVVRVAVSPKNPVELPKLIEGLNKLSKYDNLIQVIHTENEHIIAGSGELHLEICLTNLIEEFAKIEIVKSDPIVPYKETVTTSGQVMMSKSPNKHNRVFMRSEPLSEEIINDIDKNVISPTMSESTYKRLVETYNWETHDAKKLWCFGPENNGTNLLVDQTVGTQYLQEVRDSLESCMQWVTKEGVLAEENMRGIRFNIIDVNLHSDKAHRGPSQLIPCARRCYYACELSSSPRFMEPVYLVDISTPSDQVSSIYQVMGLRRALIFNEEILSGTPLVNLKAYLPVAESFGFTNSLRSATSGQAFPQMVFDHWEIISHDPLDPKSKGYAIMEKIRKRKGLKVEVPNINDYFDKI